MILIKKTLHRSSQQIMINYVDCNSKTVDKLKKLASLKYSKTHRAYYLPFNNTSWELLKELKHPIEVYNNNNIIRTFEMASNEVNTEQINAVFPALTQNQDADNQETAGQILKITYVKNRFFIKLEYNQHLVDQLKNLNRSYWNGKEKCWICKGSHQNLIELQAIFEYWDESQFSNLKSLIELADNPQILTLYVVPDSVKFVALKLEGFGIDIEYVKGILGREYDRNFKRWLIPYTQVIIDRLLNHYEKLGVRIVNRLPKSRELYYSWDKAPEEKQKKLIAKFPDQLKNLVEQFSHVMITQRYSWSTISSYTASIVRYQSFMGSFDIANGNVSDANRFLTHIGRNKVSYNEINRHCSSIKFYYSKVLYRPDFEMEKIKRPRKATTLPKVLSRQQVKGLFEKIENQKHLCMIYLLYNGGLRSGELIGVRMQDIQWDRSQLFIEGGKGKKDRVVMLGGVMKKMLQEYVEEYRPSFWLFEGQVAGHPYTANSLRKVVKRAAKAAGITQKVTTHTIRHCFATHLLESGTNIRLIQELLGHSDIKTTLIYTHVSQTSASSVVSPLDSLIEINKETSLSTKKTSKNDD